MVSPERIAKRRFRLPADNLISNGAGPETYPTRRLVAVAAALLWMLGACLPALANTVKIVALGDSLVAGHGLTPSEGFTRKLEQALREKGHAVEIVDAGVSGDTTAGGLARLAWSVPADADAVIVELGANDALRGVAPQAARDNLERIVTALTKRGLPVLLAGMLAPPNMGDSYAAQFNNIFEDLAEKYDLVLYPFFLDGVVARPDLNQADGMHPNARGVEIIVQRIVPYAEALIERAQVASSVE
jgi:acyl-CoA thioesterase I